MSAAIGKSTSTILIAIVLLSLVFIAHAHGIEPRESAKAPIIHKVNRLVDVVETTPIVLRERLYRFEYIRSNCRANNTSNSCFRFIHLQIGRSGPAFAAGFRLSCAIVNLSAIWALGVNQWDGDQVATFHSSDLEHWERVEASKLIDAKKLEHGGAPQS